MTAPVTLPPPSPALTLHMAADRLRRAARLAREREAEKGRAPADWFADMVDGYLGGPVGMLCGLLSPELADDLADHLDAVAVQAVKHAATGGAEGYITGGWPIAAARRILGEAS